MKIHRGNIEVNSAFRNVSTVPVGVAALYTGWRPNRPRLYCRARGEGAGVVAARLTRAGDARRRARNLYRVLFVVSYAASAEAQ